jgi:hypothetical protein
MNQVSPVQPELQVPINYCSAISGRRLWSLWLGSSGLRSICSRSPDPRPSCGAPFALSSSAASHTAHWHACLDPNRDAEEVLDIIQRISGEDQEVCFIAFAQPP